MTGSVKPYCQGRGCPIKTDCCRYKENIDFKTEDHFPFSPYSGATNKCGFFVGITKHDFLEQLKSMKNGTKNDSFREDGEDSGV